MRASKFKISDSFSMCSVSGVRVAKTIENKRAGVPGIIINFVDDFELDIIQL